MEGRKHALHKEGFILFESRFGKKEKVSDSIQTQIAKDAGLGRESLYKALSAGAHPRFETINAVLHALGVKFTVVNARPS